MSDEVNKAVKESILAARGDAQGAIRFLKLLLDRDEKLLREMVEPYIQGILFQHVDGMLKKVKARKGGAEEPAAALAAAPGAAVPAPAKAAAKPKPVQVLKPAKDGVLDQIVDRLAANIPPQPRQQRVPRTPEEALASIGRDPNGPPPPKAGARHQSALREVVKSFKKF